MEIVSEKYTAREELESVLAVLTLTLLSQARCRFCLRPPAMDDNRLFLSRGLPDMFSWRSLRRAVNGRRLRLFALHMRRPFACLLP